MQNDNVEIDDTDWETAFVDKHIFYSQQGVLFVNNSNQTLSWTLHTKAAGPLLEDGTFKFLHRTGSPFTPSSARKKSVIPDITLDSGETFQLGVLFTPRKGNYTARRFGFHNAPSCFQSS